MFNRVFVYGWFIGRQGGLRPDHKIQTTILVVLILCLVRNLDLIHHNAVVRFDKQ